MDEIKRYLSVRILAALTGGLGGAGGEGLGNSTVCVSGPDCTTRAKIDPDKMDTCRVALSGSSSVCGRRCNTPNAVAAKYRETIFSCNYFCSHAEKTQRRSNQCI